MTVLSLEVAAAPPRPDVVICDDVRDPLTLDPHKEFSEKNHTIVQQIYEGLVRYSPDGELEPVLAESWTRVSPTTIQFRLRQNVIFHNGEPFDSGTVKFSIERYLDPANGFPAYGFISTIAGVKVLDPMTVQVVTKEPDGLLLNRLASFMMMVPRHYIEANGSAALQERPVGTGPFQFDHWEKGRYIDLRRNARYWRNGVPAVRQLRFSFLPEASQVDALLKGDVDLLTSLPGTQTLRVMRSGHTRVIKKPSFYTTTASFNISRGPLANQRIRRALNEAINKEDLIRYALLGNGRPIATLSFPGEYGHSAALKPYPYNPKRAREVLAEEGYPKGFTLRTFQKANAARVGQILQKQLSDIGVRLEQTVVTDADLFKYLQDKSQWDVMIADCPSIMYHSAFMQTIFFAGDSPFALGPNPPFDAALKKVVTTIDPDEQRRLAVALDTYVYDEALAIFTFQQIRTYGVRREIQFTPYTTGMPFYDSMTIEKTPS